MPITRSAKKALRKDRRKNQINNRVKEALRKARLAWKKNPSKKTSAKYFSALDKAVKKGLVHKNKAARLKSKAASKKP